MEKIYERICPKCGKKIIYKSYGGWYLSTKRNCLCRECASYLRITHDSDLSILLEDTPETFYWIGFLMADGSFIHNKRLILGLSIKDKTHLLKFANFIHFTGKLDENLISCTIRAQDIEIIPKIMNKFDFKSSKTYNPPKSLFMKFNKILAMSMLIGYIDGDGSIQQKNNKGSIRIKCHSSWFNILNEIYIFLGINRIPIINKEGYVTLTINDKYNLSILKDHISTYNLPILNRKWDKINNIFNSSALHEITKLDISCSRGNRKSKTLREAKELKLNIINDYNNGMRNKDIANKYCISHGYVTKIIHGNN